MRYKIVRFQRLIWRNMMRSTKSQKASVLHYSINDMALLVYCKDDISCESLMLFQL